MVEIPLEWIVVVLVGAGGIISTLSMIIYKSLISRLKAQDKIIEGMRQDVERLVEGCGVAECLWKKR